MTRLAVVALALLVAAVPAAARTHAAGTDWPMFGYDAARHDPGPASSGITTAHAQSLRRLQVQLGGTVDSSPIYLHGVKAGGGPHDVVFVTTTYGKTEAIDAASGRVLWRF